MEKHETLLQLRVEFFNVYFENIIPRITTSVVSTAWALLSCNRKIDYDYDYDYDSEIPSQP